MPTLAHDVSFIESIAPEAVLFYKAHKISAAMSIAQACLESLYGTACPVAHGVNSRNLFGIKADSSWHGPSVTVQTQEYENGRSITIDAAFRAYPTFGASLIDYGNFLLENRRYHNLISLKYVQACNTIAAVDGYATDPHYGQQLLEIIAQFGLAKYDTLPPTHWAVTVGYFNSEKQVERAAVNLLTKCRYHSIGIHQLPTPKGDREHWTVQVGYFNSQKQAQEAQAIIVQHLKYHSISVEAIA